MSKKAPLFPALLLGLLIVLSGCSEKPLPAGQDGLSSLPEGSVSSSEPASSDMEKEEEGTASQPDSSAESPKGSSAPSSSPASGGQSAKQDESQPSQAQEPSAPASSAASEQETVTFTLSIDCKNAVGSGMLNPALNLPPDGMLLNATAVTCEKGETLLSVLKRVCKSQGIALDCDVTGYVRGIAGLYEKDCGANSGWVYSVKGAFMNVGAGAYRPQQGDKIEWCYTCTYGDTLS